MATSFDTSLLPDTAAIAAGRLSIGGCEVREVAEQFGTPLFLTDEQTLRDRARRYRQALEAQHSSGLVCFAVKAFPSVAIVRILAEEGLGFDVVGAGELAIALAGGADPARIVMHGNAKTDADLQAALGAGIGLIVIDGFDEIDRLARLAQSSPRAPRTIALLLRVSPGIESSTHAALATGGARSKFGVPADQVPRALAAIAAVPSLQLQGLHAHIGSQLGDLTQFSAAVSALAVIAGDAGLKVNTLDIGGGLGVRYLPAEQFPTIEEYVQAAVTAVHAGFGDGVQLLLEPGRSIIAPSTVTVYRVVTVKRGQFVHVAVDGGMGDNLESSLYGQRWTPMIDGHRNGEAELVDLVGRHCESGDVLAADVALVAPAVDDLVVVPVTGAYCFTMANQYNGALRIPVVLCRDGTPRLAVRRDTPAELLAREVDLSQVVPAGPG